MPSGYRVNPQMQEELGFLPLLAAAPSVIGGAGKLAGGLVKGIGSLFGGKKKKKAAPPPAAVAPTSTSSKPASSAGTAKSRLSGSLSGIPAAKTQKDVKVEALAALNSYKKSNESDKQKQAELVQKLAAVVKPAVAKIQEDVKQQALKTQVTHEHNKLVQDSARWEANQAAHDAILKKFDQLEAALVGSNAATKKVFKIYGVNV